MNSIDFNKNDFPITTNVLALMQSAVALIEKITGLVGGNYIVSGCVTTGNAVSAGFVVVNGEIMPFAGGTLQNLVRVNVTNEILTVNDASYTKTTKSLVFGSGSGQIAWSSFRKASDLLTLIDGKLNKGQLVVNLVLDNVYDYLGGLPNEQVEINLLDFITAQFNVVIVDLEYHREGPVSNMDFELQIPYGQGTVNITRHATEELKREQLTFHVPLKSFFVSCPTYNAALRIKLTVTGYL